MQFPYPSKAKAPPAQIFACIDMDAYYAQVESRRLGFSDSVPLGVKQWNGLIAVNYSARKYNINRFTTTDDARALCPNIRLPHVDTYKIDKDDKIVLSTIDDKFKPHDRAKEKVSLDFYRGESKKIYTIIKGDYKKVEIASIDEVFIDLTEEINGIWKNVENNRNEGDSEENKRNSKEKKGNSQDPQENKRNSQENKGNLEENKGNSQEINEEEITRNPKEITRNSEENPEKNPWFGIVLGDNSPAPLAKDSFELKLAIGSRLIEATRQKIYDILHYTSSAGISYNKLLAKLASGLNKPFQQTIIIPRLMPDCIGDCNINKLRFFGGKIFQIFSKKNIVKIKEALLLTKEDLSYLFENDDIYVYERLRGYDTDEIKSAESLLKGLKTKSLLSQKSMGRKPAVNMKGLELCADLIVLDLFVRMNNFYEETGNLPHNLTMNYYDNSELSNKTKSCEITLIGEKKEEKEENGYKNDMRVSLEKTVKELLFSVNHVIFPCFAITFALKNFKAEKGVYMYNLSDYLKKNEKKKQEEKEEENGGNCEEMQFCEKCGGFVKAFGFEVHLDYHLACDIDKSLNPNKKKYKPNKEEFISKNKKSKGDYKSTEKITKNNRKIDDFFKKK